MRGWAVGRCALSRCVTVALLAGCSGSQAPIDAPGSTARAALAERPWVARKATSSDLLYVIGGARVYILSYPAGELVDSFSVTNPSQLCSDSQGNVFLTLASNKVAEYPHGDTTPSRTLNDPGEGPIGCAVDPMTGDLAVANGGDESGNNTNVVVYVGGSGPPETFTDATFAHFGWCGYDNEGNLFVTGVGRNPSDQFRFAELQRGSSTFTDITLDKTILGGGAGSVQWDGKYMAVAAGNGIIYRTAGSSGTVLGTVTLKTRKPLTIFWIQGNRILSRYATTKLGLWKYPRGRAPLAEIQNFVVGKNEVTGVTVSVAPNR